MLLSIARVLELRLALYMFCHCLELLDSFQIPESFGLIDPLLKRVRRPPPIVCPALRCADARAEATCPAAGPSKPRAQFVFGSQVPPHNRRGRDVRREELLSALKRKPIAVAVSVPTAHGEPFQVSLDPVATAPGTDTPTKAGTLTPAAWDSRLDLTARCSMSQA